MTFTVIHGHPNEDEEDNQMSLMVMQFGQFLGRVYLLPIFLLQGNNVESSFCWKFYRRNWSAFFTQQYCHLRFSFKFFDRMIYKNDFLNVDFRHGQSYSSIAIKQNYNFDMLATIWHEIAYWILRISQDLKMICTTWSLNCFCFDVSRYYKTGNFSKPKL